MSESTSTIVQHTPGPWAARFMAMSHEWCVRNAQGEPIAWVDRTTPTDVGEANARLITAAPELREGGRELYALLREWQRAPFFETSHDWQQWVDEFGPRVDAATERWMAIVARVEGRTP